MEPTPLPPGTPAPPRRRRAPRAWFRARLDRDPRRWVLALAAAEGLVALCHRSQEKVQATEKGYLLTVHLAFAILAPAMGVAAMLIHGRLLWWSGRLLRGAAAPHEIHAAFAWSQLPYLAVSWPVLFTLPLRALAIEADPVPAWLQVLVDLDEGLTSPVALLGLAAALLGAFLYVKYLAEAQRFSAWRALANQLLAVLLAAGSLLAAWFIATRTAPRATALAQAVGGLAAVLGGAVAIELLAWRRRRAAGRAPVSASPP